MFWHSSIVSGLILLLSFVNAQAHPAGDVVRETSDLIVAELKTRGDAFHQDRTLLYEFIENKVVPHFDVGRMSRYVVGKHWRRANRDQRLAFARQFRTLMVRTYGGAMTAFDDFELHHLPVRTSNKPGRVTARMEIKLNDGRTIPIDYRMHDRDGRWKVYDVVVDGVSLISTYRSSFSVYINRSGIDGLINELRARNESFYQVSGS